MKAGVVLSARSPAAETRPFNSSRGASVAAGMACAPTGTTKCSALVLQVSGAKGCLRRAAADGAGKKPAGRDASNRAMRWAPTAGRAGEGGDEQGTDVGPTRLIRVVRNVHPVAACRRQQIAGLVYWHPCSYPRVGRFESEYQPPAILRNDQVGHRAANRHPAREQIGDTLDAREAHGDERDGHSDRKRERQGPMPRSRYGKPTWIAFRLHGLTRAPTPNQERRPPVAVSQHCRALARRPAATACRGRLAGSHRGPGDGICCARVRWSMGTRSRFSK